MHTSVMIAPRQWLRVSTVTCGCARRGTYLSCRLCDDGADVYCCSLPQLPRSAIKAHTVRRKQRWLPFPVLVSVLVRPLSRCVCMLLQDGCGNRTAPCEACNKLVVRKDMDKHVSTTCAVLHPPPVAPPPLPSVSPVLPSGLCTCAYIRHCYDCASNTA